MMESSGRIITWLLIAFGVKEAVLGLLQVYGYEPSNHSLYAEHPEVFPKEKLEDAARWYWKRMRKWNRRLSAK